MLRWCGRYCVTYVAVHTSSTTLCSTNLGRSAPNGLHSSIVASPALSQVSSSATDNQYFSISATRAESTAWEMGGDCGGTEDSEKEMSGRREVEG